MGFKSIRTSDLSGDVIEDDKVLTIVVKGHPDLAGETKVFDTTAEEIKALKTVENLIELELRDAEGKSSTAYVTKAELVKVVTDDKLKTFDNARGRRTGFRPNGNGS